MLRAWLRGGPRPIGGLGSRCLTFDLPAPFSPAHFWPSLDVLPPMYPCCSDLEGPKWSHPYSTPVHRGHASLQVNSPMESVSCFVFNPITKYHIDEEIMLPDTTDNTTEIKRYWVDTLLPSWWRC